MGIIINDIILFWNDPDEVEEAELQQDFVQEVTCEMFIIFQCPSKIAHIVYVGAPTMTLSVDLLYCTH